MLGRLRLLDCSYLWDCRLLKGEDRDARQLLRPLQKQDPTPERYRPRFESYITRGLPLTQLIRPKHETLYSLLTPYTAHHGSPSSTLQFFKASLSKHTPSPSSSPFPPPPPAPLKSLGGRAPDPAGPWRTSPSSPP